MNSDHYAHVSLKLGSPEQALNNFAFSIKIALENADVQITLKEVTKHLIITLVCFI